jgi:hypothetical protein
MNTEFERIKKMMTIEEFRNGTEDFLGNQSLKKHFDAPFATRSAEIKGEFGWYISAILFLIPPIMMQQLFTYKDLLAVVSSVLAMIFIFIVKSRQRFWKRLDKPTPPRFFKRK